MIIKKYITPILKWWWLIMLAAILAGATSYFVTKPMPPIYAARTTLIVGKAISEPNPSGNELMLARQLAEAYAGMVMLEPIRESTMEALDLDDLPEYTAETVPNSPMIRILVTHTNPQLTQSVANELANQLILQSPTNPERQDQERTLFLYDQLDKLQQDITATQEEIETLQQTLAELTSAGQISDVQNQINALQTKLGLLQTNYATLLENSQQGALNTLNILETAPLPSEPVGPNKILIIVTSIAAAIVLSVGIIFLFEFFDRAVKYAEEITNILGAPVLGYISKMQRSSGKYSYVALNPRSPIAEAFRTLRTELGFINPENPIKTISILSTSSNDGKTTIASNLAISFAQNEKKVLLLETDLRRPNFSTSLGIQETPGLSDVLLNHTPPKEVIQSWGDSFCVKVITAGSSTTNPSELLGSKYFDEFLQKAEELYDVIILDSPPVIVSDSIILASKVDAVLVVVNSGVTNTNDLRTLKEQLKRAGAIVVGAIFNNLRSTNSYYGNLKVYGNYFKTDEK